MTRHAETPQVYLAGSSTTTALRIRLPWLFLEGLTSSICYVATDDVLLSRFPLTPAAFSAPAV
jgi:hypothetical protein